MDSKTLQTLEFPKILELLANYCAFAVSAEKARALSPSTDIVEARRRLAETSEAVDLLGIQADLSIGGARDIRGVVDLALHGGVMEPGELLDVKYTLVSARTLSRRFERIADQFPKLYDIAAQLPPPLGIIDAVSKALNERGEIIDSASTKLRNIRRDIRIVHDRLISKLQRMVADPKNSSFLQEAIITQRDGRYVLPVKAEFKGRIQSIVHDQSSSGATLFVEPVSVVEQNNQLRELQLSERDEVRRILTELSSMVGQHAYEIQHIIDVVAELDLVLSQAKFALDMEATEPKLHEIPKTKPTKPKGALNPEKGDRHPGTKIHLYQARHPLLDPETVVPIDIDLDDRTYALVITGPNTGGKTVTLKTVGLLALMAQAGLHIPAQSGSEISLYQGIYADIGDEQSIEQSLSTFSGHITNIIRILEKADPSCLVILDELGAGTDPQEGSALARALLLHLLDRGITSMVTTHHPELKAFAHATPGVVNASVEFDLESLRPTFHLTIGLPGRSNALAIAQRLGLPESIVSEARSDINPDDTRAENLLNEIHHQRDLARTARAAVEQERQEVDTLRIELIERLENIEDERRSALEGARQEAEEQIKELAAEIDVVRRSLKRALQPVEALAQVEEKIKTLEESIVEPVSRHEPEVGPALQNEQAKRLRRIRLGDRVRLRTLGSQGVVNAISEDEVELLVGAMRVRTRLSDIELLGGEQKEFEKSSTGLAGSQQKVVDAKLPRPESPGMELDLRGERADEALEDLERYLDAAYIAGLPFVRIIHGKGTGKLRKVVREALEGHPHLRSFVAGSQQEGGEGVTIAKLRI